MTKLRNHSATVFVVCTLGLVVSFACHLLGLSAPNFVNLALGSIGLLAGAALFATSFLSKKEGE